MFRDPRRILAVMSAGAALIMGGCGFQPLHSTAGFAGLPGLTVLAGQTRQDHLVEQALERYLGDGRSPYTLTLDVSSNETRLGLSAADRATRFRYRVQVTYRLQRQDYEPVDGVVDRTVYFDSPRDPYALIAARSDAEERVADQIARTLAHALSAELERQRRQEPS